MKTVSAFLAGLLILGFSAAEAQTEFRKLPTRVTKVAYDGKYFEAEYLMTGGCAKHTGEVELVVDASTIPNTVTLSLVDITQKFDGCEGSFLQTAKVDVVAKIEAYEKTHGVELLMPKLILPQVTYEKPSSPALPSL